ncbi:MAG: hypothetical protein ABIJ09_25025, partial [Pseudomonadota bacterium]
GLALVVATSVNNCSCLVDVEWEKQHCKVAGLDLKIGERSVDWTDCTASYAAKNGHDQFRIALAPDSPYDGFSAYLTLGLGSGGNGEYQIAEDMNGYSQAAMDDESVAPGQLFAMGGGGDLKGTVKVSEFRFEAGPADWTGPLGINRVGTSYGTFHIAMAFEDVKDSNGESWSGSVESEGENLREEPTPPGGTPGDDCVAGTWDAPPGCNNESNRIILKTDGSGRVETVDCYGECVRSANYVDLTWSTSGSTLTLNYGYGETCGRPNPLNQSASYDYSCSGSSLTFDGTTWTKQ